LRFIPLALRRTLSTPRAAGFARLELGALGEAVWLSFKGIQNIVWERHLAAIIVGRIRHVYSRR
jgi:hypothetical protein